MNGQVLHLNQKVVGSYVMVFPLILNKQEVCLQTGRDSNFRIPCSRKIYYKINNSNARRIATTVAQKIGECERIQFCHTLEIQQKGDTIEELHLFVCDLQNVKNSSKKISVSGLIFLNEVTLNTLSNLVRTNLLKMMQTGEKMSKKQSA